MPQTVMIVDDDHTMNSLMKMLLELDGFKVVVNPHPELVLTKAKTEKPDVIVMDVHIGDADGLQILRALRQDPDLRAMPVIIQSGMDLEDKCKAAGASAFILKPYPPEQLSALFKKVIS